MIDPNNADELRAVLDRVHAVMSAPYHWSADTPERVAAVLEQAGYRFPPEYLVVEEWDGEPDDDDLAKFRPWCPAGGEHTWTNDAGEITARYGVNVYCDECHYSPSDKELKEIRDALDR